MANAIVGTWYAANIGDSQSKIAVTLLSNGTYFVAVAGNNTQDPTGHSGVEMGTYAWNAATGRFSFTIQVDTNGDWGLSNSAVDTIAINGNSATFSTSEGPVQLSRADENTVAAGTPTIINVHTSVFGESGISLSTPGGNLTVIGSVGIDTLNLNGAMINHSIVKTSTGYTLTDSTGVDGSDTLDGVERLHFTDRNVALDIDSIPGEAYRLYKAAFDRTPDLAGLGYWIKQMDNGYPLQNVANIAPIIAVGIPYTEYVG